ncbi:LruC domain-containing protein [Catenovulum maritimum]|uniref:Uncharacterized protein n=1 Tax=Catenovulum maritimum TaxID=1513271 RepID=A0A0J8GUX2_9ALTE|nr:LruC domain-containing protein [Catenovulum maritimum]KMT66527.1 hypothetical protein XM47_03035 [Catenovulum maritimum]
MCYRYHKIFSLALVLLTSQSSLANSFESCPTEAFLIQDKIAKLYSVNLATGFYQELSSDMGTSNKLNAMSFNFHDNYLYAYSSEFSTLVKIGEDYQVQPLDVSGLPLTSFYVGDTSLTENAYYAYRPGANYGLYKVSLAENTPDYLVAKRVIDGGQLNIAIYDFAFHPENNNLYAVDKIGDLYQINLDSLIVSRLGNTGQTGVFGAGYFDASGTFYISRNSDGFVFRIDPTADEPTAEFFAYGPASSNNDGARCAIAEIVDETQMTVDFGDAPDSYGISIQDNGPRHEISENLYLGKQAGGEDDGINIATGVQQGLDAITIIEANGEGYLNAWVDWDANGKFDDTDQVLTNHELKSGDNIVAIDVPEDAIEGQTWARFRYSSTQDIGPNGGVADGEVEDIELTITKAGVSVISYPSANSFTSIAFEDKWPVLGDYDMNDVVVSYRTRKYVDDAGLVIRYDIQGQVLALGAEYKNGFAIQLDDIPTAYVAQSIMRFELNGIQQFYSALEANSANSDAVVIISEDLWSELESSPDCRFYRTEKGCDEVNHLEFFVSIPLKTPIEVADAPTDVLNPFIFATPNHYHGIAFNQAPGRSLEIHLKNKKVSSRFNPAFFGMYDDNSSLEQATSFTNQNGMPWAIEFPILWSHPIENTDILIAYPEFKGFVESKGQVNLDWYRQNKAITHKIILN